MVEWVDFENLFLSQIISLKLGENTQDIGLFRTAQARFGVCVWEKSS